MMRLRVRPSWADREANAPARASWRRRAVPWAISLGAHLLLVLPLAFLLFLGDPAGGGGLGGGLGISGELGGGPEGDLTALERADVLGGPAMFLAEDLEASAEGPSVADTTALDLSPVLKLDPLGLKSRGAAGAADDAEQPTTGLALGNVGEGQRLGEGKPSKVPLSGRNGPLKLTLLQFTGATPESEAAVTRGLGWLARHQRYDGSWSLDTQSMCRDAVPCPPARAMTSDSAATGLALLAFLGAGQTHTQDGPYRENVVRGLKWLLTHRSGDGNYFTGGSPMAHLYSQAIATMAVCEALAMTGDPALKTPAEKGLGFILRAQNKVEGGWRYTPTIDGDTSVFGWQMFALRSGQFAGFSTPKNTVRLARLYLDHAASGRARKTYSYQPGRPITPVMTAEALLCRQYLGWPKDHPALVEGVSLVASDLDASEDRNIYYWYYATQLLHNMGGPEWKAWNTRVRDGLVVEQVGEAGCAHGSWDPTWPQPDTWGSRAGRTYQTALSLLTLEVYYRFLPLYKTDDLELVGKEEKSDDDVKAP